MHRQHPAAHKTYSNPERFFDVTSLFHHDFISSESLWSGEEFQLPPQVKPGRRLLLLWYTKNNKSEQSSRALRFHSTTAVCFTLNRSWGLTHFHRLMCSELLSVFNAQLLFWLCSRETCSLFRPLDASPEGLQSAATHGLPPAARRCQALIHWPDSAQMLWAHAEGMEDRRALCGAAIAKITIASSAKNNKPTGGCFAVTDAESDQQGAVNTRAGTMTPESKSYLPKTS